MIMTISVQSNVINSFCIWVTMFDGKNQHPKNIFELSLMQQSHLGMNKSAKKGYTFCCCFGYHFSWFYLYSKGIIVSKTHRYQSETPSTLVFDAFLICTVDQKYFTTWKNEFGSAQFWVSLIHSLVKWKNQDFSKLAGDKIWFSCKN